MTVRISMVLAAALMLSGCAPLDSPFGRVFLLVGLPALIIGGILWFMRGRGGGPRGPVYPDHDKDKD